MLLLFIVSNVFFLFLKTQECLSANILTVSTLASASHHNWHKHYLMELVRKGHNVTFLSHEEDSEQHPNFTVITLEGVRDYFVKSNVLQGYLSGNALQIYLFLFTFEEIICEYDLKTNGLKTLLNYPKDYKFDLIIWDLNCGRCLYPLIDRFGTPPVIGTSPFGVPPHMNYAFGGSTSSVVPPYNIAFLNEPTFLARLESYFYNYLNILTRRYYANPREFKLAKTFFGSNIRTIDEIERNISLVLSNIDPILTYLEPIPPNIIPVGGLHISSAKKLPQDILSIVDNSADGVIVVAFGGNIQWAFIGQQQQQAIIGAFRKLKYTILFKESDLGLELPNNVIVKKWLPLNDLLAHPNVKLLITHGGSLTTYEALYHGVPIIGIPMFVDQFGNMGKIHNMKIGKSLSYPDLTSDLICDAVNEILVDPIFIKNTKKLSQIFKNQFHSPLERAIFWTEFILKFGNADHLNLASRDFNFFQNHDLDILALIFIVLGFFLFLVYIVCKKIGRCFTPVSKQKRD